MFIVFQEGGAANGGLPNEEVDRRWGTRTPNLHVQTPRLDVTSLSAWPPPASLVLIMRVTESNNGENQVKHKPIPLLELRAVPNIRGMLPFSRSENINKSVV